MRTAAKILLVVFAMALIGFAGEAFGQSTCTHYTIDDSTTVDSALGTIVPWQLVLPRIHAPSICAPKAGLIGYNPIDTSVYIYDGSQWVRTGGGSGGGAVSSVNGQTGAVVLTTSNIAEGSNLYWTIPRTDARIYADSTVYLAYIKYLNSLKLNRSDSGSGGYETYSHALAAYFRKVDSNNHGGAVTFDYYNNHASPAVTPIASGGTGQTTATAAINALLPSQTGNAGKLLATNGTNANWGAISYVGTISCDDTSLYVFPTSGDVFTHINPAHFNYWSVPQTFLVAPIFSSFTTNGALIYTDAGGNVSQMGSAGTSTTVLHGGTPNTYGSVVGSDIAANTIDLSAKLTTNQLPPTNFPSLTGDITTPGGSLATTLKNTGTAGTCNYCTVTTDSKGRVTSMSSNSVTSGTVTSVTAGTGLSGGTITTSGTISMPNTGTAGTYGDATHIPGITSDAQGRVTGVTTYTFTSGSGITALTGDATASGTGSVPITFSTVNSNTGSWGSATQTPTFTVNGKGLITAAGNVTITGTTPGGSAGGDLSGTYPSPTLGAVGTSGTYNQITFDSKGRETSGSFVVNPYRIPVQVATTASLTGTYSNGTAGVGATFTTTGSLTTLDGQALAVNYRVLLKDQPSQFQNGAYTTTTIAGTTTFTRVSDFDNSSTGTITQGATVAVSLGTSNAGAIYIQQTAPPFTMGTTAIVFVGNAATSVVGGSVSSVTSGGTLTISPTTGAVVAGINLGSTNVWTVKATFDNTVAVWRGNANINSNTVVGGNSAGSSLNASSARETIVGSGAGQALTSGADNTLAGTSAGLKITTGAGNTVVGSLAASNTAVGISSITAVGASACGACSADASTAIGFNALSGSNSGTENVATGVNAGAAITSGSYNDIYGDGGGGVTTGSRNILISNYNGVAYGARGVTTGSGNVYIGGAVGTNTSNTMSFSDMSGNQRIYIPPTGNIILAGSTTDNGLDNLQGTTAIFTTSVKTQHLIGNGTAPTIAAGVGAGTSPTVSITGTDLGGYISVTTGTLPTLAGTIATITFNSAYGVAPRCVQVSCANDAACALMGAVNIVYAPQASTTTTTFIIKQTATAVAALTAATAYTFYYQIIQ